MLSEGESPKRRKHRAGTIALLHVPVPAGVESWVRVEDANLVLEVPAEHLHETADALADVIRAILIETGDEEPEGDQP